MTGSRLQMHNVRLPLGRGDGLFKVEIADGRFKRIQPQSPEAAEGAAKFSETDGALENYQVLNLEGRYLLPSFVDIHTHLDKAFSLNAVPNRSGTLREAIASYSARAHLFNKQEIKRRVTKAALQALSYGTTHIRTHVNFEIDVDPGLALEQYEAALEAREELQNFVSIQVVPMFPNLYGRPAKEMEWVEEAIKMGADGIGGAPHLLPEANQNIDQLLSLAVKYDKFVDLHVDENDDPAICTIEHLIEKTKALGLEGKVFAGHLCSLAAMDEKRAYRIIEGMGEARIGAITLPGANLFLQGRGDKGLIRRGVTRVKELRALGVQVAAASDNINDPFHPFGKGDLLQIGLLTAYAAHMAGQDDLYAVLGMISTIPAGFYGIKNHGIKEGAPAQFVLADTGDIYELFSFQSPTRFVYSHGQWLFERRSTSRFHDAQLKVLWNGIQTAADLRCDHV